MVGIQRRRRAAALARTGGELFCISPDSKMMADEVTRTRYSSLALSFVPDRHSGYRNSHRPLSWEPRSRRQPLPDHYPELLRHVALDRRPELAADATGQPHSGNRCHKADMTSLATAVWLANHALSPNAAG